MDNKKGFFDKSKEWVKEHKTEIIVVGSIVVLAVGTILVAKNWNVVKELKITSRLKKGVLPKNNVTQYVPKAVSIPVVDVLPISPDTIQCVSADISINEKIIDVSRHIRNLHEGWKASPEKLASALEYGIILEENQTWVIDYLKSCA